MVDFIKTLFHKSSSALPSDAVAKTNSYYVTTIPTPQNAIDILEGEWSSRFPAPHDDLKAGGIPLFEDERIYWLNSEIRDLKGKSVLELGPLEGGHSYMLERLGASEVLGIEANTRAYLKCLITKEILGLSKVRFLCGDFVEFLRGSNCPRFDVCVASGVLYHMRNPVELISLLAQRCNSHLFLWTHYYDAEAVAQRGWQRRFPFSESSEYNGFKHTLYRQEYREAIQQNGFCGGTAERSNWLTRDDILRCLQYFGFRNLRINFDDYNHPNGPSLALIADRGPLQS